MLHVRAGVLVVVSEAETLYDTVFVAEIAPERSVLGDAGEKDDVFGVDVSLVGGIRKDRSRLDVIDGREKNRDFFPFLVHGCASLRIKV